MRHLILIAAAALLAAPVNGQRLRLENEPRAPVILPAPAISTPESVAHCRETFGRKTKATPDFLESFNAASRALHAKDWHGVIDAAALARPHANANIEASALVQLEVAAHHGLDDKTSLAEKLKEALEEPCLQRAVRMNYLQMLAGLEDRDTEAQQH